METPTAPTTFTDLIKAFGGATKFGRLLGIPEPTAHAMSYRNMIAMGYFPEIVTAAQAAAALPDANPVLKTVDMTMLLSIRVAVEAERKRSRGRARA